MPKQEFNARLVRIHLSESDRWESKPLYEAILQACLDMNIAGATVFRGLEGFGESAEIHHAGVWPFANDPPVVVTIVDSEEHIARLLPTLNTMVLNGIVVSSSVEAVRYS